MNKLETRSTIIDGTITDLRIKLNEVEKMFTKKQLWDSFVEKNEEFYQLKEQADAMRDSLDMCRMYSGNADANRGCYLVQKEATIMLAKYETFLKEMEEG